MAYKRRDTITKNQVAAGDYDREHPRLPIRFSRAQLDIIRELARKEGKQPGPFIRDVIVRQYVEALGSKYPEGFFGGGGETKWGGARRGAGRKAKP